jgi:hypothetical protein
MSEIVQRARSCIIVLATAAALGAGAPAHAADAPQQTFATPDAAVEALVAANRADAPKEIVKILGPEGRKLVYSGDRIADRAGRARFLANYDAAHKIVTEGDKATLVVGTDEWPMPIPLVKEGAAWRFDPKAGEEEILNRRIGRNELNTIQVCRAIVDAQREYASKDRRGDGLLEYAAKFGSSPGQHDGLYWKVEPGEEESPLGALVASAHAEGYGGKSRTGKQRPYHGYFYRILTRQGKDARGGAYDYMVNGHLFGGFALVAFPARYGDSGVMTFIVNQDGIVYQKDLGFDTDALARRMNEFDPGLGWKAL